MAMGNTGGLFIGALKPEDKKYVKQVLTGARKNGYTRFVEPCAGALAMSYIAAETGWNPKNIEASDVSYFSAAFARGVEGRTTKDMNIRAEGFSHEELLDPAVALYAQIYLRTLKQAGAEYYYNLLVDLKYRKEEHIENIRSQLKTAQEKLLGFNYRDMDMWEHINEVADDSQAVIILCPPTYTAGYERFFDTNGKLSWDEPEYGVFDADTGLDDLYARIQDAKALCIVYEERATGEHVGTPVYGRAAGRAGMCMYLTSNRPDEAEALAGGKSVFVKKMSDLNPLKCSIIPKDYEITERSKIEVAPIQAQNALYYRKLWTHNFNGGSGGNCFGLFADGMIAGVFGYDKMLISLAGKGDIFFKFGIGAPFAMRLNRLLYMAASSRGVLNQALTDIEKEIVVGVQTTMITKYPESKEMRGLMKMIKREKDPVYGFKLSYRCDLRNDSLDSIKMEWLRKERKRLWTKQK